MTITQATVQDIPAVLALLKANHADNVADKSNGFVTTNITEEQMAALILNENGVTIAKDGDKTTQIQLRRAAVFCKLPGIRQPSILYPVFSSYALSSIPIPFNPFRILFMVPATSFSSSVWSFARNVMEYATDL